MAYFDQGAADFKQECSKKYEELKKFITSKDENQKVNEWFFAHSHILSMEATIKKQEEEIKKYKEFFLLMKGLMPKTNSIYNKLI